MEKLMKSFVIVVGVIALSCWRQVRSDSRQVHRYEVGQDVPLYVNKIGPFQNPRETYSYCDLPFCQPDYLKRKKRTLGEVLNGDRLIVAPYKLEFRVDKNIEVACRKNLTKEEVSRFRTAIERGYVFQMFYDDLPVWAPIGRINTDTLRPTPQIKYLLYEHVNFEISFNKDRVVEINVRKHPVAYADVTEDEEKFVQFFYTVYWKEVNKSFEKRMEKYDPSSFQSNVLEYRRYSIINSCITLLLLIGWLVKIYIQDFRKDLAEDLHNEESVSNQEARGWKYIRDDVFAKPARKSLLVSAIGSGAHLLAMTMTIMILGQSGMFYPHNRGRLLSALLITHGLTSVVAGFTSTSFYSHLEGTKWFGVLLLTEIIFVGPFIFTFLILNSISTFYNASTAQSLTKTLELVLIWSQTTFPFLLLGGAFRNRKKPECRAICLDSKADLRAPLNGAKTGRQVPPLPWYRGALPQMALAGFFVFGCINTELPFIINGIWGHGVFNAYSTLSIQFVHAIIATSVISSAFTAKQIASEDPKWRWRSFIRGGSVGLYVYGYCVYYYFSRSHWYGPLQLSCFFGYMACVCYGIFLMFGTVSFTASLIFVRFIYRSIKSDQWTQELCFSLF